ncbi:MAG TPA: polysaccharide pyruvyl transferase family protein [Acidimicrobiia bacterium]|nr:polysaccharide pyruvyl transferase family protein [Acidimicrobiia bacterium]
MSTVRNILVCGYYGFANAGDEAILEVLVDDLRAVHPQARITVLAGSPDDVRTDHGVDTIHWQSVAEMVAAAEQADLMVLGGGGLFQDYDGVEPDRMLTARHGSIGYYGGFALLAAMTGTPLVLYGLGIGPLKTDDGARYTRVAVGRASRAAIRDTRSIELLTGIGVAPDALTRTVDPVWRMDPAPADIVDSVFHLESVPDAPFTVTVSVRPWRTEGYAAELADALDRLVDSHDARVIFVPFQASPHRHEDDAVAALGVVTRMRHGDRTAIIRGGYSPSERMAILGAGDVAIAMRMHSVVFAARTGTPFVALAYDPKVDDAARAVGRGGFVVDLDSFTSDEMVTKVGEALAAGPVDPDVLAGMADEALANRSALEGPYPIPPLDDEASQAMVDLVFARIREAAELEDELATLKTDHRMLSIAHEQAILAQGQLEEQKQKIINSRAFRVVDSYWRAREGARDLSRKAARHAPEPLRPMFRKLAPPEPGTAEEIAGGDPTLRAQIRDQLEQALAAHPDVPGIVVYPPSIGWKVSLFQRPQQMALAYAKMGYLVFYGIDHINNEGVMGLVKADERIYLMAIPWGMTDLLGLIPDPIAISYVYNFAWTRHLENPAVVFEHIDELEVFTAAHPIGDLRRWYDEAVAEAELVVGTAYDLVDKVKEVRPDAIICPNAVDYRHFANHAPGPPPEDVADIAGGDRPIVGYYGAIAEWVDFDLIAHAADALPDFEFVFIGPEYDASVKQHLGVFDRPNVRWLGVKDYAELPAYLHVFDVATIPFVVNDVTHAVSPLKLFEYFAGERPVVTPALRECARYEAVLVAEDADDYVAKLRQAARLRHDPDHLALLRRTARANTWEMRAGTLVDALARRRALHP